MNHEQMKDILFQMADDWVDNQTDIIATGMYHVDMVVQVKKNSIELHDPKISFNKLKIVKEDKVWVVFSAYAEGDLEMGCIFKTKEAALKYCEDNQSDVESYIACEYEVRTT